MPLELESTKENDRKPSISTSMSAPLLSTTSNNDSRFHKKRLTALEHGDSLKKVEFLSQPYILSYCDGEVEMKQWQLNLKNKRERQNATDNLDINAMSVISLYKSGGNLESEMDTER